MQELEHVIDPESFVAVQGPVGSDPLRYPDYARLLADAETKSGSDESVVYGIATVGGHEVVAAAFRFGFLGGSMGEGAGERLALAMETARWRSVPFVLRTATGGARMQEGMRSLVQMPKIVAARLDLADAHIPFIAILGHPTTGGVLASLGGLADFTIAEEGATIGFAGPRVAESFTGTPLSDMSHTAASALAHGLVDTLSGPGDVRTTIATFLDSLRDEPDAVPDAPPTHAILPAENPWESVERVRDPQRPRARELVAQMAQTSITLRGDRAGGDDTAVICALARVSGKACLLIGLQHDEAPGPAAYRKAERAARVAERLRLPVVTLIDTRGADPSEDSEAAGIAWAIASMYERMLTLKTTVLSVVIGEGGSGGALAFAAGDRLVAYADTVFSVIGPEGAAQILWRDPSRAPEAAALQRLTARDLLALGIADALVAEPLSAASLSACVAYHLADLERDRPSPRTRRTRWRHI